MNVRDFIHGKLCYLLFAMAAVSVVISLFITTSSLNTDSIARHVSSRVTDRLERLDRYGDSLLEKPEDGQVWPELKGLPDDMVLYRYVEDTLHSWYNLFSVSNDDIAEISLFQRISNPRVSISSPLSNASEKPSYMNLGPDWYIVRMRESGDVKVVEGLLVKNSFEEDISKGRNGINRHIHIHGKYDVAALVQDGGSPVFLDGDPVFKVVTSQGAVSSAPMAMAYFFRWLALCLLVAAAVVFTAGHRRPYICAAVVALLSSVAFLGRWWGMQMTEYSQFFSPVLYAHDEILNSFGTLVIFNSAIFLSVFCIFLCRSGIASTLEGRRKLRVTVSILLSAVMVAITCYLFFTFWSIIRNSGIGTELYRFNGLSLYTLAVYLSYSFLCASVLLCAETVVEVSGMSLKKGRVTLLSLPALVIFSLCAATALGITSAVVGFSKEKSRVMGWSNRLAVDRDLGMELSLRAVDGPIASDPVLRMLTRLDNSEGLLLHRLEEMYFRRLGRQYEISVDVRNEMDLTLRAKIESVVSGGVAIGPDSHFLYNYDPVSGSRYTGLFNYYDSRYGLSMLVVDIVPRIDSRYWEVTGTENAGGVHLPPFYSYAKYSDSRLVSFSGNYAYPTVVEGILYGGKGSRNTFTRDGYRHFVNRISPDETIVISRRERGVMIYFVSISYLLLLIFLTCLPFRKRRNRNHSGPMYFSTRMRRLIVSSLVITMLLMAAVSVLFVYRRNERNLANIMADRISSIQHMMDRACRSMSSSDEMMDSGFLDRFQEISRSTGSMISLYTPAGRLFLSSSPEMAERMFASSRMSPEAFRSIVFDHSRYYVQREHQGAHLYPVLYAPVMGADGGMVAIASTPYMERDYDFMRDVVYHAASILSLFLILLFVTVFIASSMTGAIFHPLLAISRKMRGSSAYNLEPLDYDGDDEISALVGAYNGMVTELRESTARLAAAERDKAWSEMARQVAHEIKNPLTPIKLEVQRLMRLKQKNDPSWEEKFDKVSEVVLEHIDILSQTANEFSTFAKLYTEDPVEMDLDATLRDQILLFDSKGVEITYLGTENAAATGPKPQIIRVFINLLTNAVQAVAQVEAPKVTVSLRRGVYAGTWDMVFEDNGPGVDPENVERLFTPNFTTKSSGTGLGLAICRSIVDRCGGHIAYSRSFTLGGACFTVTLPESPQTIDNDKTEQI